MLSAEQLERIRQFDTCTIANAIEQFGVRLRNEGFTRPGLRCVTGDGSRLLGYAATCKVRSSDPPVTGGNYLDRTDWWAAIDRLPLPRVAVIQDMDPEPGTGSSVGEVHAAILKALRCAGAITNGAVRDVPEVGRLEFPLFAPFVAVSHSYMHLVDFGQPVEILGLAVRSGDLIYADCHGAISIPREIAAEIPDVAARIRAKEQRIVQICLSSDFSTERLLNAIRSDQR
ncbi:MAG: RraA family protein [Acidobacteriia bacterium]|nr:RraA family protein [Terriglobia bacterium]